MDLSVIVPCYNTAKFIPNLLSCLKAQKTHYEVEYIFVLNNCTDNTVEVIKDSGLECTILSEPNQGCGLARNTGFDHSSGAYIWFMDSDDWLLSNTAIEQVLDAVKGKRIIRIPFESDGFPYHYFSMVWQYCFSRELIKDVRFRKEMPSEDDAYMDKVLPMVGCNKNNYISIPCTEKLYYYNYGRPGSNMVRWRNGETI